ncbi:MAG TPA: DUF2520 domain-containing protein [Panacibacter sp.]|nr:DUF2520 domain-containing protein [Panacibacter sp.]HNP43584.1 DUF2520 domain-containing protein [Panacibacter sp.]
MNVSLIGSGNVATVLGRLIKQTGHSIDAIISRNPVSGNSLAEELGAVWLPSASAELNSELYIIAVSDTAVAAVADELTGCNALVLHTSGAVSKEVLKPAGDRYGVLYPLQSLRKELKTVPVIPFLIDGSSNSATQTISHFAKTLSGFVQQAGDAERLKMHLSAVIVSNFTNHLYALAHRYCQAEGLDFNLLHPLIKEVAGRLALNSAENLQTGPAIRGDGQTIEKHLQLLGEYPSLQSVYQLFSESITGFYQSPV